MRGRLIALGEKQGFDEGRVREAVKKQTGRELDDLSAEDLKPLVENAARKVNEAKAAEGNQQQRQRVGHPGQHHPAGPFPTRDGPDSHLPDLTRDKEETT